MELKPGKRKKLSVPNDFAFLPAKRDLFTGQFNGVSVSVKNDTKELHNMGFYGKGNMSKSAPSFNSKDDLPEVLTNQQYLNRMSNKYGEETPVNFNFERRKMEMAEESIKRLMVHSAKKDVNSWSLWKSTGDNGSASVESTKGDKSERTIHHCPWNDDENEEEVQSKPGNQSQSCMFTKLVDDILKTGQPREMPFPTKAKEQDAIIVEDLNPPRLAKVPHPPAEVLQLSLQEAFFLALAGRLRVLNIDGTVLEIQEMWNLFRTAEEEFLTRYVGYHWFRSQGWVVRSGIKYGGDFLLYEKGPPFFHSSYVVHVATSETFSWSEILMFQRVTETSNKDLLLCYVLTPADLKEEELKNPEVISRYQVQEAIYRRWIPSQQRVTK